MVTDLLDRIMHPSPPPFALLHRPTWNGDAVDVLTGDVTTPGRVADIPSPGGCARQEVLAVVPFRQIAERGFERTDDGAPLIAMHIDQRSQCPVGEVLRRLPDEPIELANAHFDVDDDAYADMVRRIIEDEIGEGSGANFVIRRSFLAEIVDYTPGKAVSFFRRLLALASGTYWTYIIHTGERTFVGASPERHVSLADGQAVMNPISGTYCYPPTGPNLSELLGFLSDRKEAEELYMVLDEELKMMARVCDGGAQIDGPYLKEMDKLAHTEYVLHGPTSRQPGEILHETMFAPTVTGSPLESACRVINRYERKGRGYYSGVVALIGCDEHESTTLDSAIMIRSAEIDRAGCLTIGTGATLVRDSDPASEVAETRAKTSGLLAALEAPDQERFGRHPRVQSALEERNANIATFWLADRTERARPTPALEGLDVLIIDAEDTFTSMLEQQLRSTGLKVTIRQIDDPGSLDEHDLVVLGPGPGDPRDQDNHKIARLLEATDHLLSTQRPFLSVCLSHQVLSLRLGLAVEPLDTPHQGLQREIDLFGSAQHVGFYNTFSARSGDDKLEHHEVGVVTVSRDHHTDEVFALRGQCFASLQFHPESVLTRNGVAILSFVIEELVRP